MLGPGAGAAIGAIGKADGASSIPFAINMPGTASEPRIGARAGLADFEAAAWVALVLPKGTLSAIVERLHDATIATMSTPGVRERLMELGEELVTPERGSPEYLQQFAGQHTSDAVGRPFWVICATVIHRDIACSSTT